MCILAIDQGTTGTTAILYNRDAEILARSYREISQIYPQPGWVEHNPQQIWESILATVEEITSLHRGKITALGITNQRETTIVWDKKTGLPVQNAIVWQCRRTASLCAAGKDQEEFIKAKTGLPLDAYFSATKLRWILERLSPRSFEDLLFGTVDTWLVWKLTGGAVHATDFTNASRTMLFNLETKEWDDDLCRLFAIPRHILPELKPSASDFGTVSSIPQLRGLPICGVAGDQQASLYGQGCVNPGQLKNTYGTGCFIMMNTGQKRVAKAPGLITTAALGATAQPCFALEGSVFIAGAALQFLRDELKLIKNYDEVEESAKSVPNNAGVYLVPAFTGLGAPYWDMEARGTITGLTRGANRNHIIRAALEAMAYQTQEVISVMEAQTGMTSDFLLVDGGAVKNRFLLQFQADILNKPVCRSRISESTSLGAAFIAGLRAGIWKTQEEINALIRHEEALLPSMNDSEREALITGWQRAVRQARTK